MKSKKELQKFLDGGMKCTLCLLSTLLYFSFCPPLFLFPLGTTRAAFLNWKFFCFPTTFSNVQKNRWLSYMSWGKVLLVSNALKPGILLPINVQNSPHRREFCSKKYQLHAKIEKSWTDVKDFKMLVLWQVVFSIGSLLNRVSTQSRPDLDSAHLISLWFRIGRNCPHSDSGLSQDLGVHCSTAYLHYSPGLRRQMFWPCGTKAQYRKPHSSASSGKMNQSTHMMVESRHGSLGGGENRAFTQPHGPTTFMPALSFECTANSFFWIGEN